MKEIIKYIVLFFSCTQLCLYGQLKLDDITLSRIEQRKIRRYIKQEIKKGKHQFKEIHSSWGKDKDLSSYRKSEKSFFLKGKLQDIWNGYVSANPSKSWEGGRVSFGLLLQKYPDHIFYRKDAIGGVDTGQVYFLNLKILLGAFKIPVAFEIITVNNKDKVIEFSYLDDNKSKGVQRIQYTEGKNGKIKIVHTSYFKSDSNFRDKFMYPFFHRRIINSFHRNMKKILTSEKYVLS
ncbi:MAG: hypothetical protein JST67_11270 [Bacteroidetes bacterium]|nr:hypothetical protein [Bacteroidota bacterium]